MTDIAQLLLPSEYGLQPIGLHNQRDASRHVSSCQTILHDSFGRWTNAAILDFSVQFPHNFTNVYLQCPTDNYMQPPKESCCTKMFVFFSDHKTEQ